MQILKNLSDQIKSDINDNFDNDIITKIINYYDKNQLFINSSNISDKELIKINKWWK
jgi:hypothetical protein